MVVRISITSGVPAHLSSKEAASAEPLLTAHRRNAVRASADRVDRRDRRTVILLSAVSLKNGQDDPAQAVTAVVAID
ncbi:hypothetical protein ACOKM3_06625 [Streptomyces sp. BH106]|uniref:hypothetical protein n=1 Tax=Streptomyces sp. BH106 TaxID=3410409 RepID=UPI003CF6FA37